MNENSIDSLYMKAFEVIKTTFDKPSTLISWVSDLIDAIHEYSRHFKYIGNDRDGDMNIHLDLTFAIYIGTGWIEDNTDDVRHFISCFKEDFNKVYNSALAAYAWRNACYDMCDLEFLDTFKNISALFPIFDDVDKAWDDIRAGKNS